MKKELENESVNVQQHAGQVNNLVDADLRRPAQMDEDRRQRLEKLDALRLTTATEVAPEVSSLSVDGIGFFALDDVHAIKAKAKQGKTTMLKVCLSAWLRGSQFRVKSELEEPRILWLDTEQKQSDVKLIISDVLSMAGVDADYMDRHLFLYGLRKRNFDELMDGHRDGYQGWTHVPLIRQGLLPLDWQLYQCLYGQHLLPCRPEAHVCVVESEKTALVMACLRPRELWLATGGSGGLTVERVACLRGRRVTIFPDSGCYEKWSRQMQQTDGIPYNISSSLEAYAPNTDLCDLLLGEARPP